MLKERGFRPWVAVGALLALPALHPLLIPFVGVPSHLLWWVHVLPVALVTFRRGQRRGLAMLVVSALLVLWGERVFGAGYGRPASWGTAWALTIALAATNVLVAGFAVYARRVARRYDLLFDNAASAILWTDAEDRIVAANPATRELFACGMEELRGRRFDQVPWLAHVPAPATLGVAGWAGVVSVGCPGEESSAHLVVAAVASEDPPGHQVLVVDRTTEGTLYTLVGATLGASLAFLVARHVARSGVERRLGASEKLRAVDEAVGREGGKVVFLLRLSPVFPFNALNYAPGLTRVRFRDYVVASLIGMAPGTFMYVYAGYAAGQVAAGTGGAEPRGLGYYTLLAVGLLATIAVTVLVTRTARRALHRNTEMVPQKTEIHGDDE